MTVSGRAHVVIIGGGFGGLQAARGLGNEPVRVTVIDRKNHHTFQPLLYQVATAGLSPGEIAASIRGILRDYRNIEVLMGYVEEIDTANRVVHLGYRAVSYDYLIIAAGATHSYFGHDEYAPLAPGLKTIEDALEIRRRVLLAFEYAEAQASGGGGNQPLTFVVIGGGATGVELAGTLAEVARHTLAHNFRQIDPRKTRILLLEGGPRILPAYTEDLSASAERQLHELGVEVRKNAIGSVEPGHVRVGEEVIAAPVILWAAGVAASPLGRKLGAPTDKAGRVLVNPDLSVPGHPEVFVVGDLAHFEQDGKMLPGVAPVAMQEGRWAAKVIAAEVRGERRPAFHYRDKGTMATIGRARAIADLGPKLHVSGFPAWLLWLFVHIMYLVGFRNRLLVLLDWAWAYFTYQRAALLITGETDLPGWEEAHAGPEKKVAAD